MQNSRYHSARHWQETTKSV